MKMKWLSLESRLGWLYAVTVTLSIWACNKPSSGIPSTQSNITQLIAAASNATMFDSVVVRSGMDSIFSQPGPYTVFLPINSTYAAAGITQATLDSYPDSVLKNWIEYGTVGENLIVGDLPVLNDARVISTNGDSVFLTSIAGSLWVNGIPVVAGNVYASNGYIDIVSYPIFPPTGNLLQTLQADSSLSLMVTALAACSSVMNLDSLLTQGGIFTVFAANNNAFIAAGYPNASAINSANPDTLANLMSYQIVPQRMFTCDWSDGQTITMLNDSTIRGFVPQAGSGANFTAQGIGNVTASNIIFGNVMARNGVIHKTDQILLP